MPGIWSHAIRMLLEGLGRASYTTSPHNGCNISHGTTTPKPLNYPRILAAEPLLQTSPTITSSGSRQDRRPPY